MLPRANRLCVTEGGTDEKGIFHNVSSFDDPLIALSFCRQVFSLLLKDKLISIEWVRKILSPERLSLDEKEGGSGLDPLLWIMQSSA